MRAVVLIATVSLVGAGGAHATAAAPGTLTGIVQRGPVTPVCAAEIPCDEPAGNVALVFSRAGSAVARTRTTAQGRYRVRLPAGLYTVRRANAPMLDRKLDPNRVRVRAGRVSRVDFSIDTGIR